MRLKRKDAKKPPEVPPKPAVLSNPGANGHNHNNHAQQETPTAENGSGAAGGGGTYSIGGTNKHGGIAVLPQHITTLTGHSSSNASSCSSSMGGGGGGPLGTTSGGSVTSTPQTPRKFSTLQKKTPRHKKMLSHHSQLWTDEEFLQTFFTKYFFGSEKLVLPMVCRKWRGTFYSIYFIFILRIQKNLDIIQDS